MWFKRLFKKTGKKEIKQKTTLTIKEVEHFLKRISLEKEQSLIGEFNDIFIDIKEANKSLFEYLVHFEEESLPSRIGEEEKQKITKTRMIYTSRIRAILMNLTDRINKFEESSKTNEDTKGIREIEGKIYQPFKKSINAIIKNLNYEKMLLNNFFSNELSEIDKRLDVLKEYFEKINQKVADNNEFFESIDSILKNIKTFDRDREIKIKKKNELPKILEKYNSSKKLKERILSREQELRLAYPERYKEYRKLIEEIEEIEKEINLISSELVKFIIPLQKEFDAYTDIYKIKKPIVNGYLTNPLQAFLDDEGLEIIQILNKIASLIDEGVIKTDDADDKIEKINDAIKKISELDRQELKKKHEDSNNKIKELKTKIRKNKSLNDFDDIFYKIRHINSQFDYINDYVQEIKKTTESIHLVDEIRNIEKRINNELGEDIEIKIDEEILQDDKSVVI